MDQAEKKIYFTPSIEEVKIDSTISLQLESSPPNPENETTLLNDKLFVNSPFGERV
jgi:hypothetical protein